MKNHEKKLSISNNTSHKENNPPKKTNFLELLTKKENQSESIEKKAKEKNLPLLIKGDNGSEKRLVGFDGADNPIYIGTHNQ